MVKILVTGGAGFIGSNLVDALIDKGYSVVVLDNLSTGDMDNVDLKAKFVRGDIRDDLAGLFEREKFDYVFHLAAQINVRKSLENPKETFDVNVVGSLNLIDNCIKYGVKKIIFSSTGGAIYSPNAELPCNEDSLKEPLSPYGYSKFVVEGYLKLMKDLKGLDYVALRYSNVYGPRQNAKGEAGVVSIFMENMLKGDKVKIFGSGEQTRDYVYVGDVVGANVLAMGLSGEFNVATGVEVSVNELAEKIKELFGLDVRVDRVEAIQGELMRNVLANSKLVAEGWRANFDLDLGLRETYEWFKNR